MNIKTKRLYFSVWKKDDKELAIQLWGNKDVTRFISKNGFTYQDIIDRLHQEITTYNTYHVQYFPIFLNNHTFIGVCGLHPYKDIYELGFHLLPDYWHQGYGYEAAKAIIDYAFNDLHIDSLYAGHHPQNSASKRLLLKLGFIYQEDQYYPPTGLKHPSYILKNNLK